ncbi:unnamed protein product [Moneuplotes crassus]|uniref:Uncharacterized protein n=1 Tax=Euplotes crassus TaxID=5936 RepID=A0AAD1U125_EUPCR|nr:unnamed protein product [Moneuplotes crassus]
MNLQGVIEMMNDIQKALQGANLKFEIDLPRIAVVGAQSSGKSSVLESIVGEDFLPRGTGIVTRCPLILQLIYHKGDTYAKFDHLPKIMITDFNKVRDEIEKRTNVLAGSDKKIVNKPIYLTIYSKNVPNLTLIDLPGFTRLDLDDQESGISDDIEALVMEYIVKENTIILAISPANNDIANSDGLLYAKNVDPNRDRTFGVMTKIDIMDKGTNALDFINGTKYKLKHGYIGVKCRSQDDNNKGKTIKDSLEDEKNFFRTHPDYKDIAHTQGTSVLAQKLSVLLGEHIKKHLPFIQEKIHENLADCEKSLQMLGPEIELRNDQDAVSFITKVINQYCNEFQRVIEHSQVVEEKGKLLFDGGALIYEIFQTFMEDKIGTIDPLKKLNEVDILSEIRIINGIDPSLFVPREACKSLIVKKIDKFSIPSINCARHVYSVIENSISLIDIDQLGPRKVLRNFLNDNTEQILELCMTHLTDHIKEVIESEKSYIDYDDPDFRLIEPYLFSDSDLEEEKLQHLKDIYDLEPELFSKKSMEKTIRHAVRVAKKAKGIRFRQIRGNDGNITEEEIPSKKYSQNLEPEESDDETELFESSSCKKDFGSWKIKREIDLSDGLTHDDMTNIISMKRVIKAYLAIIKKQFKSRIPKCIVKFLIKDSLEDLRGFLFSEFIKHEDKIGLAQEDSDKKKERDLMVRNMHALKLAKKALRNVKKNSKY